MESEFRGEIQRLQDALAKVSGADGEDSPPAENRDERPLASAHSNNRGHSQLPLVTNSLHLDNVLEPSPRDGHVSGQPSEVGLGDVINDDDWFRYYDL
jgi:hypothetical protein